MGGGLKRLLLLTGLAAVLGLSLATVTAADAQSSTQRVGVVGLVRVCGPQPVHPPCRRAGDGHVKVRSDGDLLRVAPMRHGRFSIPLHPGQYGVVVVLAHVAHGSHRSRAYHVRVVAHRTTHITIRLLER